jgi:hypothetical protein
LAITILEQGSALLNLAITRFWQFRPSGLHPHPRHF